MKKNYFLISLFLLAVTLHAQTLKDKNGNIIPIDKFTSTPSGLKYFITEKGRGVQPKPGDKVSVHYTGKLQNDSVFDSSLNSGQPFSFVLGTGKVIKGWDEGIALLNQGDKAILIIPPTIGYGPNANGPIPANSTLVFDVELVSVTPDIKVEPFDVKGRDTITTASGLKYIIVTKGSGEKPKKGSNISVHYTGYFRDGKIFDSSVKRGEPIKFAVGQNQVIKGWDEGLMLMQPGEKARLIIPYNLAYGENGRPPQIGPKTDLIFDVELISVSPEVQVTPFDIKGKKAITTASGLQYIVVKEGKGAPATKGSMVKVHYTGYLDDGSIFDSSVKRGDPIKFQVGVNQVIPGWDEGLQLMKVGDKFRLIIPGKLAYGEKGVPNLIGPNATLTFDVELMEVTAK